MFIRFQIAQLPTYDSAFINLKTFFDLSLSLNTLVVNRIYHKLCLMAMILLIKVYQFLFEAFYQLNRSQLIGISSSI